MSKNKILSQTDYSTATHSIDISNCGDANCKDSIYRDSKRRDLINGGSILTDSIWRDDSKRLVQKNDDFIDIGRGYKDPTAWEAMGHIMKNGNVKNSSKKKQSNINLNNNTKQTSVSKIKESTIENAFRKEVKKRGGLALKFTSQSMNGVPDRLVLMLGGRAAFVELKAPGKTMRPLQIKRREQLEALGFPVFCVDNTEQINPVIDAIECWSFGSDKESIGAEVPKIDRGKHTNKNLGSTNKNSRRTNKNRRESNKKAGDSDA